MNLSKQSHLLKLILLSTITACFGLSFAAVDTYAGFYAGDGAPATGGGFSGGGGGSFPGYSWVYYKYVGGASHNSKDVTFTPSGSIDYGYGLVSISSQCAKEGGFWHIGYTATGLSYPGTSDYFVDFSETSQYVTERNKKGHFASPYYSLATKLGESTPSQSSLKHQLYQDGVYMYNATKVGSNSKVLGKYQSAANTTDGFPDNLGYFCYSEDDKIATFQSASSITVTDGTNSASATSRPNDTSASNYLKITKSDQVTTSFSDVIKRTDSNGKTPNTQYLRSSSVGGVVTNYDSNLQKVSLSNNNSTIISRRNSTGITINPGETKAICGRIGINRNVKFNASTGDVKEYQDWTNPNSQACINVFRPWNFTTSADNNLPKLVYVGEEIKSGFKTSYTVKDSDIIASGLPSDAQMIGITFSYGADTSKGSVKLSGGDTNSPCSLFNGHNCHTFDLSGFNVQDYSIGAAPDEVGAKVCTATAINYTESDADGNAIKKWRVSNANCAVVAKKPAIKAEGGNTYADNNITTSTSFRNNTTYGSWGEYLVIANSDNNVRNFASGASLRNGIGGNKTTKDFSPLTIANNDSNNIGKSGISAANAFLNGLAARFIESDSYNHDLVNVIKYPNQSYTLNPADLDPYKQNIIYARNISIPATITEVNAWLIASDTINTCAGFDINTDLYPTCDAPLTIHGVAYAPNFKFLRTHGSINLPVIGVYPNTTAETIQLTPDDYRRSFRYATTNYMQPTEVYTQELAPRV